MAKIKIPGNSEIKSIDGNPKTPDNETDNSKNEILTDRDSALSEKKDVIYILNLEKLLVEKEKQIDSLLLSESELKLKNEQLLTAITEKDNFFTIIAHDLRNPLHALKGFIQILYEEFDSLSVSEIKEITLHIKNSTTNFSDLLENLMIWSRVQRRLAHFNYGVINLQPVIKESISLISESALNKGIELTYKVPDNLTVFADVNMLLTILRNLISNALKFTPQGGKILVSARNSDEEKVEISVSDTGIGMSRAMIRNLFKLDQGTNRNGSEGEPGTGLGLIICRDFIENLNGRIWVESKEQKGSIFYFTLPMNN
jgi:signal transduction histidine kinase